jgi:hypothetical protein
MDTYEDTDQYGRPIGSSAPEDEVPQDNNANTGAPTNSAAEASSATGTGETTVAEAQPTEEEEDESIKRYRRTTPTGASTEAGLDWKTSNPAQKPEEPSDEEKKKARYLELYREFARDQPKTPDYRNEKAERMGNLIGNVFKMVADSVGVAANAHDVTPYKSGVLEKIGQREDEKRLKYQQELKETDDYNKRLKLKLEEMRRDDDLAEQKAQLAREKLDAENTLKTVEYYQKERHHKDTYNQNADKLKERKRNNDLNYNVGMAKAKASGSTKPKTTISIDVGDGEGAKNVPLYDGDVSRLYEIIRKQKGVLDKYGNYRDAEIALIMKSMESGGYTSQIAINNLLAKYPELIKDEVYKIKHGKPRAESGNLPAMGKYSPRSYVYTPPAGAVDATKTGEVGKPAESFDE